MKLPFSEIENIPNGSIVAYRGKEYYLQRGIDGRIVTDSSGYWKFVKDLKWKVFETVYTTTKKETRL